METTLISPSRLLKSAFELYRKHLKLIVALMAAPTLFIVGGLLVAGYGNMWGHLLVAVGRIAAYAFGIGLVALYAGQITSRDEVVSRGMKLFFPAIWVSILAGLATMGGFFLFIIPGIVLTILLSIVQPILVVEDKRGFAALIASWNYTKEYKGKILWRMLVIGVCFLLTVIVIGILGGMVTGESIKVSVGEAGNAEGNLVTNILLDVVSSLFLTPVIIAFMYLLYRNLKDVRGAASELGVEETSRIKKKLIALIVVAIVGMIIFIAIMGWLIFAYMSVLGEPGSPFQMQNSLVPAAQVFSVFQK